MMARALKNAFRARLLALRDRVSQREPNQMIGGDGTRYGCYMARWWIIPRNKWFNVYLHHFQHSDDDRALHDHPWWWASYIIEGSYIECTSEHLKDEDGEPLYNEHHDGELFPIMRSVRTIRDSGSWAIGKPTHAHRVMLFLNFWPLKGQNRELPCWTIFVTGPPRSPLGFSLPEPLGSVARVLPIRRTQAASAPAAVKPERKCRYETLACLEPFACRDDFILADFRHLAD